MLQVRGRALAGGECQVAPVGAAGRLHWHSLNHTWPGRCGHNARQGKTRRTEDDLVRRNAERLGRLARARADLKVGQTSR
jgi:hypothetical protein